MKKIIEGFGGIAYDFCSCLAEFWDRYFVFVYRVWLVMLITICFQTLDGVSLYLSVLALILIIDICILITKRIKKTDEIPKLKKRLTRMKGNGDITMSKADTNVAIVYVHEIEEYLVKHGHKYKD